MDVEEVRRTTTELNRGVASLLAADLEGLEAEDLMAVVRDAEVVARRLDAWRVAAAGALDRSAAYTIDGHRSAKAALRHLGRLSGPEAARRVRTARALRQLPEMAAAFAAGQVPVEMAHAIGRAASNLRVGHYLPVADPIFAEQSAAEAHDEFIAWLAEWERLADADGADRNDDEAHRRRTVTLVQSDVDGSWLLRGQFGALEGAVLADALAAFVAAEEADDHDEAVARVGPDATSADWARSAQQRRADALIALIRRACTNPSGRAPLPLVNVVIDQASFEEELARRVGASSCAEAASGFTARTDDAAAADARRSGRAAPRTDDLQLRRSGPAASSADGRICSTSTGHRLHPHDALAAALIGHVRRVVIDGEGRVTDLGRTRRLFTGAAREAAELQHIIDTRGPTACLWSGCTASARWVQIDHEKPWAAGGTTDQSNANLLCGHHNRLKESGYLPVRGPDGSWTFHRPDGTTITPAA